MRPGRISQRRHHSRTFRAFGRTWPALAGGVITPMQRLLHVGLAVTPQL